jgi:hypothetical protein
MREEPVKADYLSPHIELKGFRTFKRSCSVCDEREACLAQGCEIR